MSTTIAIMDNPLGYPHTIDYAVPFVVAYTTLRVDFTASGELQQHQITHDAGYLAIVVEGQILALVLTAPDATTTRLHVHHHPAADRQAGGPLTARILARQWAHIVEAVQERCAVTLATAARSMRYLPAADQERSVGEGGAS